MQDATGLADLLPARGVRLQPKDVVILGAGVVVVVKAEGLWWVEGPRVRPAVQLRVPVGERNARGRSMVVSWNVVEGGAGHDHPKEGAADAVRMHLGEHKQVRRPRLGDIHGLLERAVTGFRGIPILGPSPSDERIHGVAADNGVFRVPHQHGIVVGGTSINGCALEVRAKKRVFRAHEQEQIRIVGRVGLKTSTHPGEGRRSVCAAPVKDQGLAVVAGIQRPDDGQLLEVVDALDGFGLALRLCQGGQEHPREDRDDGDNNQQFDQRDRASSAATPTDRGPRPKKQISHKVDEPTWGIRDFFVKSIGQERQAIYCASGGT